jgi:hypothetical protein
MALAFLASTHFWKKNPSTYGIYGLYYYIMAIVLKLQYEMSLQMAPLCVFW